MIQVRMPMLMAVAFTTRLAHQKAIIIWRQLMRHYRILHTLSWLALCIPFCGAWCVAQSPSSHPEDEVSTSQSYPIAAARRKALSKFSFDRDLDAGRVQKWRQLASATTIAEFELFLSPFSQKEKDFIAAVERMPLPIIHRLKTSSLRNVLKQQALLSVRKVDELGLDTSKRTTPSIEQKLFGGFGYVFTSVAPPYGTPRYGDVIIRVRESVRDDAWAATASGANFIRNQRNKDDKEMEAIVKRGKQLPDSPFERYHLGFDDRLHHSHYLIARKHWNKALAYQGVLVVRNLDKSPEHDHVRQRFNALLRESDSERFWTTFIPPYDNKWSAADKKRNTPFGYLEGRYPDRLSTDHFLSIEVPANALEDVRAWPEAAPFLKLLRAKPKGVN